MTLSVSHHRCQARQPSPVSSMARKICSNFLTSGAQDGNHGKSLRVHGKIIYSWRVCSQVGLSGGSGEQKPTQIRVCQRQLAEIWNPKAPHLSYLSHLLAAEAASPVFPGTGGVCSAHRFTLRRFSCSSSPGRASLEANCSTKPT